MYSIKFALYTLINIIIWIIIIKSLLSWAPGFQFSKIYQLLDEFTAPIEMPIRKVFGRFMNGPIDFSPMIAILLLILIQKLIFIIF